jgi:hypothetical protein
MPGSARWEMIHSEATYAVPGPPWQQMPKMASPCGWIFAGTMSLRLCCVENGPDAPTEPRRGFRLLCPERLQDSEDSLRINLIDWTGSKHHGTNSQAPAPLLAMLLVRHSFAFAQVPALRAASMPPMSGCSGAGAQAWGGSQPSTISSSRSVTPFCSRKRTITGRNRTTGQSCPRPRG